MFDGENESWDSFGQKPEEWWFSDYYVSLDPGVSSRSPELNFIVGPYIENLNN